MTFGFSDGPRNFRKHFSVSCEVFFCFDTDRTGSIKRQDLEPRQRICDCFLIHTPQSGLCDQLLSNHQTSLLVVELRQCVSCNEPLLFGSQADVAISGFWEVSKSGVHHSLFWHFRGPFRIWVLRNLCGCKSFCIFEIIRIGLVFLFFT